MKKLFKSTKINGFLLGDILLVIVVVFALLFILPFTRKYISAKCLFAIGIAWVSTWGFALYSGKSFVKNKSGKTIYAKCENDSKVIEISDGSKHAYIDGINVNGKVYKISDGAKAVVKKDGSVSFGSFLLADATKCGLLSECPSIEWKPLFDIEK